MNMEARKAMLSAILVLQLAVCAMATLYFSPSASEMRVGQGGTAKVICLTTGPVLPSDNFTWSKSGQAVEGSRTTIAETSSGTGSQLIIENFRQSDAGVYSCSFTGLSDTISVTLIYTGSTLAFLDVPLLQQVAEGRDAIVSCPAYFGNGTGAYTYWTYEDGTDISDARFTDSNREELRIHEVREEDAEQKYKCNLVHNDDIIDTRIIAIEVRPHSVFAPSINDTARRIEVVYGGALDLPCLLDEPKDNVVYSWTINTEFEHDHIVDTHASLHRDSSKFLGGVYTCRAENEFGYDLADFTVKIVAPPLPSMCSLVRKTTALHTTVVLKYCDLTSPVDLTDLEFQWSKTNENGAFVDVQLGGRFSINHNGWLTIENVQQSDLGTYRVSVTNEMGRADHTVQLELVGETAPPTPAAQVNPLTQSQRQLGSVPVSIKIVINGGNTNCNDIQEMNQAIIRNHLSQQFNLAGVSFERATVTCSSDSSYGIFNFVLRGEEAQQVAAEMRQQRIPDLTLNNGQTVTLKVCANECSLEGASIASSPISLPAGVIVAAMFILVVVACLALLIVILMKYRRRNLSYKTDEEQVLPLKLAASTHTQYRTHQDNFDSDTLPKKPIYGRSVSINFPLTR